MTSSLRRIGRLGCPVVIIGALALSSTGIAGAQSAPSNPAATALQRHFQHEDALYAVSDRAAKTRTPADAMALHFKHEDRISAGSQEIGSAPQRVGVPSYTPRMLAAHFDREDGLYQSHPSLSALSDNLVSPGFNWGDWALGLGSGIVLILALAGLLAFTVQRRHRLQAT